MKIAVHWDVMPCSLREVHRRFDEICLLRFHRWKVMSFEKFRIFTLHSLSTFYSPSPQLNSSAVHQKVTPLHSKNDVLILRFFNTINVAGFSPSPSCSYFHFGSLAELRPLLKFRKVIFPAYLTRLPWIWRQKVNPKCQQISIITLGHNTIFVIILMSFRIFKLLKMLHLCSW
jgi:hypothetical protein